MQNDIDINGEVAALIPWEEVEAMVRHWAATPDNGYLGDDYGYKTTLLFLLKNPQSDQLSSQIISKMKTDIPLLQKKKVSLAWDNNVPNRLIVHVDDKSVLIVLSR